jgi:hypothetical protein
MDYMHDALSKGIFPTYLNDFLWRLNDLLDLPGLADKERTKTTTRDEIEVG